MTIKDFFTKTPKYKSCLADNLPLFFQVVILGLAAVWFLAPVFMMLIKL